MKPSICFVSLNNYALLSGDPSVKHIGGAEVQQTHIARGLSVQGFDVRFVTLDHGQRDGQDCDGVTVYKAYRKDAGLPGLRFLYPRCTGLWHALSRADADIYYQRGADVATGLVAAWCRRHHRRFIFSLAHDSNCFIDLPLLDNTRSRYLARYGIQQADVIISQTQCQRDLLQREFGRDSVLIRSCAAEPADCDDASEQAGPDTAPRLLWVGRFSPRKRLDVLLDTAAALPRVQFDVVGAANATTAEARVLAARADTLANVTLHGYVPNAAMAQFYRRATALICTSSQEGFPNTFLEAWSRGLPVITTLDPDALAASGELGAVETDPARLPAAVERFLADSSHVIACGRRARAQFEEHHRVGKAVAAYAGMIEALAIEQAELAAGVAI